MKKIPLSIVQKIEERKKQNSFRELIDLSSFTDFYSNDYLGLSKWNTPIKGQMGSTGSRLISGNLKRTEEIEQELATFFGMSSGLMFNSGYDANLGLFSSVPQKSDTVIYDQLIHASIRDGIRLGSAKSFSFSHNDPDSLKDKLKRAQGDKYVAVEAIYSMDGDNVPLNEICAICEEFEAHLIVDEAHSGGIIGEEGAGLVSKLGLNDRVFAKLMTFGKAYGSHGALVLGDHILREHLINFARSFIYTTAISPHAQERILSSVDQVKSMKDERVKLFDLVEYFKTQIGNGEFELQVSDSPIQSLIVPGNDRAKNLANKILDNKIAVKAILHPTVSEGKERLRFCVHSYNSKDDIQKLADVINA